MPRYLSWQDAGIVSREALGSRHSRGMFFYIPVTFGSSLCASACGCYDYMGSLTRKGHYRANFLLNQAYRQRSKLDLLFFFKIHTCMYTFVISLV